MIVVCVALCNRYASCFGRLEVMSFTLFLTDASGKTNRIQLDAQQGTPVDWALIYRAIEVQLGCKREQYRIVQVQENEQLELKNGIRLNIILGPNPLFKFDEKVVKFFIIEEYSKSIKEVPKGRAIQLVPSVNKRNPVQAFKVNGVGYFKLSIGSYIVVLRTKGYNLPNYYDDTLGNICTIEHESTIIVSAFDEVLLMSVQPPEGQPYPVYYLTSTHPFGQGELGGQSKFSLEHASIELAIVIPLDCTGLGLTVQEGTDSTQLFNPFTPNTRLVKIHTRQEPLYVLKKEGGHLVGEVLDTEEAQSTDATHNTSLASLKDSDEIICIDGCFCDRWKLEGIQKYISQFDQPHTFWLLVRQTYGEPAHKKRKKD